MSKITTLVLIGFMAMSCGKEKTKKIVEKPKPSPYTQKPQGQTPNPQVSFSQIQPYFQRSCLPCHGGASPQSGVDLSSEAGIRANFARAASRIQAGTMPPQNSGKTRINQNELAMIRQWFQG